MPVLESLTGTAAEVDNAFKAARATLRPMESLAWLEVAARSGALAGAAANSAVFSLRNMSANPLIVRRLGIGWTSTTGFTVAQELAWGLMFARAFTVSDTAGTAISLAGNNCKVRTSLGALTSVDCRISAAVALTAGTKTLDTNHLGIVGAYAAATTAGNLLPPSNNNLQQHDPGDYPLVLAQNEGINVMNLVAMGAAGVGTLTVTLEVAEALLY